MDVQIDVPTGGDQAKPQGMQMPGQLTPKLDEETVMGEFRRRAASGIAHRKDWQQEAKELYDFQAGRQWDSDDEARMKDQNRPMVTFNLMAKFIDVVMGLQINNRQDIRCYPRHQGDAAVNDLATGALAWCREQGGSEYEESDAGGDVLLTGMGWIEDFYDDQTDPGGTIAQERRDPLEMLWDPMARKKNLIDRRWQARLKRMQYDEYVEVFDEEPTGSVSIAGMDPGDLDAGLQIINKPQDYNGDATRTRRAATIWWRTISSGVRTRHGRSPRRSRVNSRPSSSSQPRSGRRLRSS